MLYEGTFLNSEVYLSNFSWILSQDFFSWGRFHVSNLILLFLYRTWLCFKLCSLSSIENSVFLMQSISN